MLLNCGDNSLLSVVLGLGGCQDGRWESSRGPTARERASAGGAALAMLVELDMSLMTYVIIREWRAWARCCL